MPAVTRKRGRPADPAAIPCAHPRVPETLNRPRGACLACHRARRARYRAEGRIGTRTPPDELRLLFVPERRTRARKPFILTPSVLAVMESDRNSGTVGSLRSMTRGEWELALDFAVTGSRQLTLSLDQP